MDDRHLRVFFFSDWRVQPLMLAERMLESVAPVDLVLYGGDDVERLALGGNLHDSREERLSARLFERCQRQRHLTPEQEAAAWRGVWFGDPAELIRAASRILGREPQRSLRPGNQPVHIRRVIALFAPEPQINGLARLGVGTRFGVGAVIGNDCMPEHNYLLAAPGLVDLHVHPLRAGEWGVAGLEGGIVWRTEARDRKNGIGYCLTEDEEVAPRLEHARAGLGVAPNRLIIVSHTPPEGTLDIGMRFGFDRLGSPSLMEYIDTHHPALVLSGHCHSCGGRSVMRGDTVIVNGASSDTRASEARAALIEVTPGKLPTVQWIDPTPHSVLFFPFIGKDRAKKLGAVGIERQSDLLAAPDAVLRSGGLGDAMIRRVRARAIAISTGTAVRLGSKVPVVPDRLVFFDVETGLAACDPETLEPEPHEPWMIAAKVAGEDRVYQWCVPEEKRNSRRAMYDEFMEFVRAHHDAQFCSWTNNSFDFRAITAGLHHWRREHLTEWTAAPQYAPLRDFMGAFALPAPNWRLGSVSRFCGWTEPEDEMDGFLAGLAYELYRRYGEPLPMETIARYNANDVRALEHVVTWFARNGASLPPVTISRQNDGPISRATVDQADLASGPMGAETLRQLAEQAPAGFQVCPNCGTVFFPRNRTQVYCDRRCKQRMKDWRTSRRA